MPGIAHHLTEQSFREFMAPLGPFEMRPRICVAVSGGGDSMALASLLAGWTDARGGQLIALTVDHGLRPGSASECRQVSRWMREIGVEHHALVWAEQKPKSGVQERAREARYALMENWCRENGVLHLAVAHTLEDQAETFLMRLNRGSGPDGLAGMSAVVEKAHCRILRPLLSVSRQSLREYLTSAGREWLEDPSNLDPRYERVRWRRAMVQSGLAPSALAAAAERYAGTRAVMEHETAKAIARTLRLHPLGFVSGDLGRLRDLPGDLCSRVVARALLTVGGKRFPARRGKLEHLVDRLRTENRLVATLGGCRVAVRGDRLQVCRENRGLPQVLAVAPGSFHHWDQRFVVGFREAARLAERAHWLAPLGDIGRGYLDREMLPSGGRELPKSVTATLPALVDEAGIVEVPHLGFVREDVEPARAAIRSFAFKPLNSLSGRGFFVAI